MLFGCIYTDTKITYFQPLYSVNIHFPLSLVVCGSTVQSCIIHLSNNNQSVSVWNEKVRHTIDKIQYLFTYLYLKHQKYRVLETLWAATFTRKLGFISVEASKVKVK